MAEQMFQYALYCRFRAEGADVALDAPRSFIDTKLFALGNVVQATSAQIAALRGSTVGRIKEALKLSKSDDKVITDSFGVYSRQAIDAIEGYYRGTWASQRYFEPVADEVAATFVASAEKLSPEARSVLAEIEQCDAETVALHVHKPTSPQNTCTTDYYNWAIANLQTFVPEARIVVFTDAPDLVKQHILLPEGSRFVPSGALSQTDVMQVMLRTSHIVCANTLTSWWAAWLMPNPDKIVIVPQRWSANPDVQPRDLMPIYWTAIPVT